LSLAEAVGFSIRNAQLGRCVQMWAAKGRGRVSLEDCAPGSELQLWRWHPDTQMLTSLRTGECLSAPRLREHEPVRLQPCRAADGEGQAWGCSRKGHLTLQGKALHLSARLGSAKVFLSRDRGPNSKWRTLGNQSICAGATQAPSQRRHDSNAITVVFRSEVKNLRIPSLLFKVLGCYPLCQLPPLESSGRLCTGCAFSGVSWKIAMLVLCSLALLLGLTILILNVHYNRKKKIVCVLKSYSRGDTSGQAGRGVPDERAPLTQRPPQPSRSPSLRRGEILIEWKDGTVTPLFDN
uniref:Si:dkey-245n4.2 n=1 Tax=Lepisosteus oculatus TaxID=7918 RepID=W5MCH0_LEPOC